MGRAYFSAKERDAGYCQLFVESLAGPALTWFSRLAADSISTFKELSTEFLKHYSMYIRQGWKISQGQKESLHDFMERFKNLVSKVDVPDKTAVEALRNALAGPALTWFSRLAADSISTFKELSTEFLKHYSMYIRQGWKISQGQKESLHDFMERFKNLVSKVDVPDKTAVEALRNALWIRSYFRSDLYTNSTISLEDALHRANCFIRMEEDNAAYTAKQNALKAQLTPKATTTYQEPRQHQPNEKKGKVFSATEEPDASPSTSKTDRPWNVWDRTLDGKPLTYDETKFCTYHKAKGHDTKECKQLAEALFSAFKNGTVTPDPPKSKQNRKKGSWTKNRQAGAKKQESNQAVHPDDQDAAAPPRHRDDTDTEDERPQVARRINVISETHLPSCAMENKDCSDLRDHLQHRRPTVDLRDILLQRKKLGPPKNGDDQDLRDHLQHKRSMTELQQSPPQDQKSESTEGNDGYDLRDHMVHVRSTRELRDPHSQIKKSVIPGDDLQNKLSTKTGIATPDLGTTLSDKRPCVFRRINVIHGGSPLCNDSVKSIKEYQRRATTARRWPTKHEGETFVTFSEGDLVDIDQPHNDPLLVELQIGTCEVTRILIDTGSSVDLIFRQTLEKMLIDLNDIKPSSRALTGFNGSSTSLLGTICLNVFAGGVNKLVKFSVIDTKTQYNAILGTPWLHMMKAIPSTYHQCIKFPTKEGTVFTLKGNQRLARSMLISDLKSQQVAFIVEPDKKPSPQKEETVQVGIDPDYPERTVGIGSDLSDALSTELTTFLRANKSTFAWTTADMPGIDPAVTSHRLNVDLTNKPIKQKRRKLGPERAKAVNIEVDRLLGAGSIAEVKYPDWLANPVVVKKKNGKWRVCIDFTDLNKACPKDSFPIPHIDQMVESTAGNELLSFMDAFSGYNQIMMHPDDREKTSFITDRGTYCYRVMPFGVKNAGATYQRLVNKMFADKLGVTMEVYIDDMLVKSLVAKDHVRHLSECFDTLNKYGMKLNPAKCTFGVTSGEFLGYIVTKRGIEANPKQISAVLDLPNPKTSREIQRLTGRVAALNRFISRSTDKCLPFYELLRGNKKFLWDEVWEQAFSALKQYLTTPPVLTKPDAGDTLYLYIAVSPSAVSSVLIKEDRGEQRPIFYTSKCLTDAETRYPTLEKMAFAVVTSARKLRPYFQSHSIVVLTDLPLRTILQNANQSGRLSKWAIELSEYDISYKSRLAIKAQVLADFIVEISPDQAADLDIPVKNWILHVDRASSNKGSGIGVHLQSPTGDLIEQSFRLGFAASNEEAEYEALIAGLRLAKVVGAKRVQAFCDSQLVTSQYIGDYEAKNERMDAYLGVVRKLTTEFDHFELFKVPRKDNCFADALAALGSNQRDQVKRTIPIHTIEKPSISLSLGKDVHAISSATTEIVESTTQDTDCSNYVSIDGKLHRWTANKVLLTCVGKEEAELVMIETHKGEGGNHSGGRALALKLRTLGHYWPPWLQIAKNTRRIATSASAMHLTSTHQPSC
ncbi:hypothetical protein N665_1340s0002 [Sinapis alba]|nr:hypothetical protein N665_1340s0002 [Sinapis alba]